MFKLFAETVESAGTAGEAAATWSWSAFFQKCIDWIQTSGLKLLIGLIVLFILFSVVNFIAKRVKKGMEKKGRDKTITNVVYKLIKFGLKLVLFVIFLGYVGIDTAGIGTIIASVSVAIGLAVQGSLANLAGWFVIIIMRPFKIGDFITAQGETGTVEDIRLFYTYIVTVDNKVVMLPNGALANGNITNYSMKDLRRVDNVFQISYGDDAGKAIRLVEEVLANNELVLKDPESFVKISACASSGIEITVRAWCKNEDYWTVYFTIIDDVKKSFDNNGITVPFNQIDVHMIDKK